MRGARMLHHRRLALDHQPLAFRGVGLRRNPVLRRRLRLLARHAVGRAVLETQRKVAMRNDRRAVLREAAIAARVVAMEMRVDDILDRLAARQLVDLGLDLVVQRRELGVDLDDGVTADRDDHVPALAFQHVGVVAERRRLDLNLRKVLPLCECGGCEQARGRN